MSLDNTPMNGAQTRRAMQALHAATWFALCQGDRYSALGRKSVANSFYNLLPMLAEVRKAVMGERDAGIETVEVIDVATGVAARAGDAATGPRLPHAADEAAVETLAAPAPQAAGGD